MSKAPALWGGRPRQAVVTKAGGEPQGPAGLALDGALRLTERVGLSRLGGNSPVVPATTTSFGFSVGGLVGGGVGAAVGFPMLGLIGHHFQKYAGAPSPEQIDRLLRRFEARASRGAAPSSGMVRTARRYAARVDEASIITAAQGDVSATEELLARYGRLRSVCGESIIIAARGNITANEDLLAAYGRLRSKCAPLVSTASSIPNVPKEFVETRINVACLMRLRQIQAGHDGNWYMPKDSVLAKQALAEVEAAIERHGLSKALLATVDRPAPSPRVED